MDLEWHEKLEICLWLTENNLINVDKITGKKPVDKQDSKMH